MTHQGFPNTGAPRLLTGAPCGILGLITKLESDLSVPAAASASVEEGGLRYIPALDALRGIAIAAVFIHHALAFPFWAAIVRIPGFHFTPAQTLAVEVTEWLASGVDLFFVLSGFLITRILLHTRGNAGYYRAFYISRACRIFPLYYLFLALCLALPLWQHPPLGDVPWYLTYLSNHLIFSRGSWQSPILDHTWSLAIEEQFYWVWPVVIALMPRRAIPYVAALIAFGSIALRFQLTLSGAGEAVVRTFTLSHLDGIMYGALLACVSSRRRATQAGAAFAGAGLVVAVALTVTPSLAAHPALGWATAMPLAFGGIVGLVLGRAEPQPGSERSPLQVSLSFLGKYSYCIYLLQQPVLWTLASYIAAPLYLSTGSLPLVWLAMLVASAPPVIAIAMLSYRFYEAPWLRLKSRLLSTPIAHAPPRPG
ncbi:acyltransferase [Corallococcus sp. BB11-1]|uniref:acyltransferase family protein n=1 Tax=Corallococcus sp. BB11-1 TaxID=2996783 RepID=UPI002270245F|nr:acyltransferase [Corallococcus sp. BB11-1]MCY1033480.1 acyltransferase [Corallococcus sp. BB11-1]